MVVVKVYLDSVGQLGYVKTMIDPMSWFPPRRFEHLQAIPQWLWCMSFFKQFLMLFETDLLAIAGSRSFEPKILFNFLQVWEMVLLANLMCWGFNHHFVIRIVHLTQLIVQTLLRARRHKYPLFRCCWGNSMILWWNIIGRQACLRVRQQH